MDFSRHAGFGYWTPYEPADEPESTVQEDTGGEVEPTYSWTISISGSGSDFAAIAECYGRALTTARSAGHSIDSSSITAVDIPTYSYEQPF